MQNPNTGLIRLEEHIISSGVEDEIAQILSEIALSSKMINSKIVQRDIYTYNK